MMVATGVFLSTMDSSMINVALPSIMRSFESSLSQTEWVVLIYLLTITTSLLFWGGFADRHGKSRIYLAGMLVFTVGSLSCSFSATLLQLCLFRFVQALGASMMMATGPAIIKMVFPIRKLGTALGAIGIATSTGLMTGPVISGMLLHHFSWRAIFLVTVPVSLTMFCWGWFKVRPFCAKVEQRRKGTTDWVGMLFWILLVSAVVLLSTVHHQLQWQAIFAAAGAVILLFLLFLGVELRQAHPLFPLSLFRHRSYSIAMFCAALSFTVLFVVLILMPFYMDYILGMTTKEIGFIMMAIPITVFVVSPFSGMLFDRIGARVLTTGGLTIAACGLISICFLNKQSSPMDIAWRLAMLGCGQALFLSPNSAEVLASVKHEFVGISAGLLATARNLGMLLGVSLAGLLFGLLFTIFTGGADLKEYVPAHADNFMAALSITFAIAAVLSLGGALLSGLRYSANNQSRTGVEFL